MDRHRPNGLPAEDWGVYVQASLELQGRGVWGPQVPQVIIRGASSGQTFKTGDIQMTTSGLNIIWTLIILLDSVLLLALYHTCQ